MHFVEHFPVELLLKLTRTLSVVVVRWRCDVIQSGIAVALEIIADSRNGGFDGLIGAVDSLRQRHGSGIFASDTPAEVTLRLVIVVPKTPNAPKPSAVLVLVQF